MSGVRYDRILASTALALILAAPAGEARSQSARVNAQVTAVASVSVQADRKAINDDRAMNEDRKPAVDDTTGAVQPTAAPQPADTTSAAPATPVDERPAAAPADSVAATPAVPADPLASLDAADRPIAEKIGDLLAAKTDRLFTGKKERAAVDAFYRGRNLAPLWFDKGVESARTKAVVARLKAADADGLDVGDYKVPSFDNLAGAEAQAEAELKMTQVVLTYARHLQAGRFPYTQVSKNIELPQTPPNAADVLATVADAQRCRPSARPVQPAATGLSEAQGSARGDARQVPERPPGDRRRPGAQADEQAVGRGRTRADAARAPRGRG